MDKKISQLSSASALQGDEIFPVVQSNTTKKTDVYSVKNYIVPTNLTVSQGTIVDLAEDVSDNAFLIKLTWSGGNGTMELYLPSAASNINRTMRITSDGSFGGGKSVHLLPAEGDELDGSSSFYNINKSYEGIKVWSDGVEWFIIQKKA